ncbi:MAG: hypothetical protein H7X95_09665 [Deltaproteobacteria bacterium]|nr:hypothetical protein [Deltaproteobacteria bacterium]
MSFSRVGLCRTLLVLLFALESRPAEAVRPFITDDARVVGARTMQLETWIQVDRLSVQHWVLPAFGPTDWLELTIGAVHGFVDASAAKEYSIAGPLLQAKTLLYRGRESGPPAFGFVVGALTPGGTGPLSFALVAPFAYAVVTESLLSEERLLIHANIGVGRNAAVSGWDPSLTAGFGTQIQLHGGLKGVAEIFWNDAYVGDTGAAWQAGVRYVIGDHIQVDTTCGSGFGRDSARATWLGAGLRMVGSPMW